MAGFVIDARKEKASFDRVSRGKASVIESRIRRGKVVIPDHVERVHRQAFFQILSAGCSSTILPALCPACLLSFSLRPFEYHASDLAIISIVSNFFG